MNFEVLLGWNKKLAGHEMKISSNRRFLSKLLYCTASLVAGALMLMAPAVGTAMEPYTNKQFLQLCQVDPDACQKRAEEQGRASALALKLLEVQTGQCIVEFPKNIGAKALAEVGLDYIHSSAADPKKDSGLSFSHAFMEKYPCSE